MKTKISELLSNEKLFKKEKQIAGSLQLLLKLVDDSKFSYFTAAGYKSLSEFIQDSRLVWDGRLFLKESEEIYYNNMLNCMNFQQFYGYHNLEAEEYQLENFTSPADAGKKKNMIRVKLLKDLKNYEQLADYFILKATEQMEALLQSRESELFTEMSIRNIIREWFTQEHLNGIFLLIDITDSSDLQKKTTKLLDYINIGEDNRRLQVNVEELLALFNGFLSELSQQRGKIVGRKHKIEDGQELLYRKPKNPVIILDLVNENCVLTPANLDKIYRKTPTPELKLLQLFLHEYATYIFTSHKRAKLHLDFTKWFDVYREMMHDEEIRGLMSILHQNREKITDFTAASESYADIFGVYYYNYFRNGENTFRKMNGDKQFLPEVMEYVGDMGEMLN